MSAVDAAAISAAAAVELLREPVCGMTWGWTGIRGTWTTPAAEESMRRMAEHAVTWTAIAYAAEQATPFSTEIPFEAEPTVTDDEIVASIRRAHGLGMKVCLKPVVNVADGTWRANIGFFDWDVPGEPSWTQWFASYRDFILHAARIAEAEGCEMLCIGCEMVRADGQEAHWRALIAEVRAVYTGPITYNCDKYQEDRVTWWDAVDVISSSGYYPIDSWQEQLDRIERVALQHGKPFFFMEAGCPSREGSAELPNDWNLVGSPSGAEQVRYFGAMFAACRARPWVRGLMLWDWPADLYAPEQASLNDDYCPYGKPAADVMMREYRAWAAEASA
ncbi:glycoside hydrolase family 113 [Agromyces fucosus]